MAIRSRPSRGALRERHERGGGMRSEAIPRSAEAWIASSHPPSPEGGLRRTSAPRNDKEYDLTNSPPSYLQRRQHRPGDIGGAAAAAELHRLDAVGIDLVDGAL